MAFSDWSTTAGSNTSVGGVNIGEGMNPSDVNNAIRAVMADAKAALGTKGADIASATTTDLGAVAGLSHDITGTTTITGFGTIGAGIWKVIKFEGALTLTHNATSLILPGGANITTADGDIAIMFSEGSGNWRCVSYFKAGGAPVVVATQAQMEAASSTVAVVTPGTANYHPGVAKGWAMGGISGTTLSISASHNVTTGSCVRNGEGDITIAWETDFSSVNYAAIVLGGLNEGATNYLYGSAKEQLAGSLRIQFLDASNTAADPVYFSVVAFGDQA